MTQGIDDSPFVSFIMPALNEQGSIGRSIASIKGSIEGIAFFEIIVVDNGSTDRTVEIARAAGAQTLVKSGVTISTLRNTGAGIAKGNYLVFIDADVILTKKWREHIGSTLRALAFDGKMVTGSICGVKENPNWIERSWFSPIIDRKKVNYINSGHLIVSKDLFTRIGGFREDLGTGEDYEFCKAASAIGATIVNAPELSVVHEGYPGTVREFFRRERWHGRGDFLSARSVVSSKPAVISVALMCVFAASVGSAWFTQRAGCLLVYPACLISVSTMAAGNRCRKISMSLVHCIFLYALYFVARGMSLYDRLRRVLF